MQIIAECALESGAMIDQHRPEASKLPDSPGQRFRHACLEGRSQASDDAGNLLLCHTNKSMTSARSLAEKELNRASRKAGGKANRHDPAYEAVWHIVSTASY